MSVEELQSKIILSNTADKDVSVSVDGLTINYDKTTIPKNFNIQPAGVSWTDGTLNFSTGLGRLASIQEAFQAVQLPPNAFTLKLNDSLLLTDGVTDSAVHSKTQSLITDGIATSNISKDRLDISATDILNTTGIFNAGIAGVAGVNCGMSVSTSSTFTAPYPPATASASINTTPTTASIGLVQTAPFSPTQLMSLDLNNLTHNNSDGATPFNISSNNAITMNADNIDLNTTGRLILPSLTSSNYLDYDSGSLKIINGSAGGSGNVLLLLQNNSNIAGATTFESYKNDLPTSTGGDNIASWSATCNTNIGKTETSRINHIAYGVGASNNDGGIALTCKVNSTIANFLVCNGGAGSGEVQVFKPITAPTGNIEITANASTGVGDVFITAKNDANITANGGNVNIISNGAGDAINLTSVSSVNIEATGDNLTLTAGAIMVLDSANVELLNTNTTTASPNHNAQIQSTTNGLITSSYLKLKLNNADIWIPYFTTDPSA